jgi:starch synthase (maltosyl-transferring)
VVAGSSPVRLAFKAPPSAGFLLRTRNPPRATEPRLIPRLGSLHLVLSGEPSAVAHPADHGSTPADGRRRAVIEGVSPEIDGGRFPAKRVQGEDCRVEADIFTDGHDLVAGILRSRKVGDGAWRESRFRALVNDRYAASFPLESLGDYEFTISAWVAHFASWQRDFQKRIAGGQDTSVDLKIGIAMIAEAAASASGPDGARLKSLLEGIRASSAADAAQLVLGADLAELMFRAAPRQCITEYPRILRIAVDRPRAAFSTWYELFPRSASAAPDRHGTFRDVITRLDYIAEMGFDVLYLPPVHPIGRTFRKGKNNKTTAEAGDVGSPWAAGSPEGGHKAIHPELGTFDDFAALRDAAAKRNIELALDIAFQCSPDHPYVRQHPEWFRKRPDGTIQYAENPPKKYQDIYPFDFESPAWQSLWEELASVFLFWAERGVRIFRVDNPHTKAFPFWEWCIARVRQGYPDAIFLAEAFTRPKVMYRLAKVGFTQSYTYFAWKNSKWELEQYFSELARTKAADFFRPNAWPNTPDILNEFLQTGGRPGFMIRLLLAGTLCANYGIYGPAFELLQATPREPGSEEYLDSEKYQLRHWDLERPESLAPLIARLNRIRRENPALQQDRTLRFHRVENHDLICYSKSAGENTVITVVNVNPRHPQSGVIDLPLAELGIDTDRPFQAHDLLTDARYIWHGPRQFVSLDPGIVPAHIFRIRRRARSERDFEYFV